MWWVEGQPAPPVDDAHQPDFTPLVKSSESVGKHLKKGAIVVYESTVYPGATEEVCIPVLEKESGMKWKQDFFVGYSPERINPGDREHRFETIRKVVSGCDAATAGATSPSLISRMRAPACRTKPTPPCGWP